MSKYKEIKAYEKREKRRFDLRIDKLNNEQKKLNFFVNRHNQRVKSHNKLIQEQNILQKELEKISLNNKKTRGRTFGLKKVTYETHYSNGNLVRKKNTNVSMNKIEIYGFNSLQELKVILAHEIAHLVQIPHLEEKGALMNSVLQENQLKNLELTEADVRNFRNHFKSFKE